MPRLLLTRSATLAAVAAAAVACNDPIATRDPASTDAAALSRAAVQAQPDTASQYIVFYKPGRTRLANPAAAAGAVALGNLSASKGTLYTGVTNRASLAADANVAHVLPNYRSVLTDAAATAAAPPPPYPVNATYFRRNYQWDMKQIRADSVPFALQGTGAKVCIIDTGIDKTHQELAGKVVAETSFVDVAHGYPGPGASAPWADSASHGTHVASTVTGNGVRMASTAPRAQLMTAKVFAATGSASSAAIFDAIDWCSARGADVVNMSLGALIPPPSAGLPGLRDYYAVYQYYIDLARGRGTVVVAAAGNNAVPLDKTDPNLNVDVPAQLNGVQSVGATGPVSATSFPWVAPPPDPTFDGITSYTNFGPDVTVYAPGGVGYFNFVQVNIIAACSAYRQGCSGGQTYWSIQGTSMASPHAAGVAAVITSRATTPRGLARARAVEACLAGTGDPIDATVGPYGNIKPRVNALRAATNNCPGL